MKAIQNYAIGRTGVSIPHMDSFASDLRYLGRTAEREVFRIWDKQMLAAIAANAAAGTNKSNRRQVARVLADVLAVRPWALEMAEPEIRALTKGFVLENVDLIKAIPEKYFGGIQAKVEKAQREGTRVETLAKELSETAGMTRRHARLIARDQVGKLFGDMNKIRQQKAGISRFVWRTMQDERVREEHEALDGEEFSWDDPPGEGIPGEPIQCRCTAEPVLEEP
jgi:SPP1 gp7 family putative phage head morphogenesis protein